MSTHPIRLYLAAEARRLRDALVPARRGPLSRSAAEFKQPPGTCGVCGRRPGDPPRTEGRFRYHGCPVAPPHRGGPPPGTRVPKNPASATRWTK